jgi:DNA-binding response OmpR family regulator
MTKYSLLLLEDDLSLGEILLTRLQKEYRKVTWAKTLAAAREQLKNQEFDLLILDVGLPDGSGFDLAKEQEGRYPIIFLTALNTAEDRLRGYELGADEYIPKPFHLKELIIRIDRTLMKSSSHGNNITNDKVYNFDDFSISLKAMTIQLNGQDFYPSKRDFDVLVYLIEKRPHVVSREELLDKLWGEDSFPTNRTVDNTILRIRQFLGKNGTLYIKSVRGIGYQWIKEEVI